MNNERWTGGHTAALIVIAALFALYAWSPIFLKRDDPSGNITTWIIFAALMAIFMAIVGYGISGRFLGILIDERNVMSLSRFQMVLWTLVILPGWFAAAVWNTGLPAPPKQATDAPTNQTTDTATDETPPGPLDIAMPAQIWALLGISTASLVGTPLILKEKTKKETTPEQKLETTRRIAKREGNLAKLNYQATALPVEREVFRAMAAATQRAVIQTQKNADVAAAASRVGIENNGQLFTRTDPKYANASDMFHGDEVGNAAQVDLSKVQMFFFTLILVLAYTLAITTVLTTGFDPEKPVLTFGVHQFPAIDPGMAALLAISHAGYLGYKAAPHTKDAPDTE